MNALHVLERVRNLGGSRTLTEVKSAIASKATIREQRMSMEKNRYSVVIWDKKSAVNGVLPDAILKRYNIPDGASVYLVYKDGQLMIIQPFAPGQPGFVSMTGDQAVQYGNASVDHLVSEAVDSVLIDEITEELL